MQTLNLTEVAEYLEVSRDALKRKVNNKTFPVPSIKGFTPKRWYIKRIEEYRQKLINNEEEF